MQCPRCGENTPGTLSGCARCGAPVDQRPDPQAAQPGGAGVTPSLDVTMLDPQQPPAPRPPATPEAGLPPLDPPPPAPWANMTMVDPLGRLPDAQKNDRGTAEGAPAVPAQPPAQGAAPPYAQSPQPSVQSPAQPPVPGTAQPPAHPPAQGSAQREEDPGEDTQAWTMPPEDEDETPQAGLPSPPAAPAWAAGSAGFGGAAAPPAANARLDGEALVPDSWFAEPRPPGPEDVEEQPGAPANAPVPQQWTQDAAATAALPAPVHDAPAADRGWNPHDAGAGWQGAPAVQPGADPYQSPAAGYGNATAVYEGGYPPPTDYPQADYPQADYPAARSGSSNKPLAIGVAILVVIALGAVGLVLWPDGGDPAAAVGPSASATPRSVSQPKPTKTGPSAATVAQAKEVNALLNASADTRNTLGRALHASNKCKTLPAAIQDFQRVAVRRNNQIRRTKALQVDQLKDGERLRASLLRSFQLSLQVDQEFLAWAKKAQRRCKGRPKHDAHYRRGNELSAQATVAKKQFTLLWNPIAREVGLPTRTDRQF